MRRRDKKKGRTSYPGRYEDGKPARRMDRGLRDTKTNKYLIIFADRALKRTKLTTTQRKRRRRLQQRRRAVA